MSLWSFSDCVLVTLNVDDDNYCLVLFMFLYLQCLFDEMQIL